VVKTTVSVQSGSWLWCSYALVPTLGASARACLSFGTAALAQPLSQRKLVVDCDALGCVQDRDVPRNCGWLEQDVGPVHSHSKSASKS
jgi:hypothetical protein